MSRVNCFFRNITGHSGNSAYLSIISNNNIRSELSASSHCHIIAYGDAAGKSRLSGDQNTFTDLAVMGKMYLIIDLGPFPYDRWRERALVDRSP